MSSYHDVMSHKLDIEESGLSFREKSLWITFVATLVVYAYYFWRVLSIGDEPARVAALFLQVVFALVVVIVAGNIAISVRHRPESSDERDQAYALRAARIGYYVLATGAFCALAVAAAGKTFWTAHAILAALVLAELVKDGSQLFYYRRGT